MSKIKPQAGEWWSYNGVRVYVVGVTLTGHTVCEYHDRSIAKLLVGDWWQHLPDCKGFDWKPEPEIVYPVWCVPTTQNALSLKDRKAVACFRYDTKESGKTFHCDGTSFEWNAGWLDTTTMRVVSKEEALARITSVVFDPKTFTSDWGPFPKSAEPDPEEWVTQDRVPARLGIDQESWIRTRDPIHWRDLAPIGPAAVGKMMHGQKDSFGDMLLLRCRRKDLPPLPEQPPKPNRIPVRLYWYDGNVVARYGHTPPTDPSFVEIKLDPQMIISGSGFYVEGRIA